jgi:hypothetical protein
MRKDINKLTESDGGVKSLLTPEQKKDLDETIKRYESGKAKVYTLSEVEEPFRKKRMKN